ncbi:MAG: hypothetical protein NTW67_02475 [Candidatus Woesearchaeota archaeon]|nr:hypothetical protein [Candidatus Woesearchaeota archaeon]
MNGRVLWSAQEALKILEKEICSPKDFTLYIDSKKSLDEIKDALVKKLKARIASYHAVELDGNRIELWYDRNYDPKAKTRQSKYLVTLTRTDLSRSLDEQKKLKAELEVFFKNLGKTYLSSRLFS